MNKTKEKKKILPKVIIAIIILIIVAFVATYILHTQKLLPSQMENFLKPMLEKVDSIFGIKDDEESPNSENTTVEKEQEPYTIIKVLDKNKYKDIQIEEILNPETMIFATYTEKTTDEVSLVRINEKYGLISNKTGEIVVEPRYVNMYSDITEEDYEYIVGMTDTKTERINLSTFEIEDYEMSPHGGGSLNYYEPNKKEVYTEEYEYTPYESNSTIVKRFNKIGTTLDLCYEKEEDEMEASSKVGYFNVKTGKIEIEPEYENGTQFINNVAAVKKDGKAFFINEDNEKVYDLEFEDAQNIHNGNAWVKIDGNWTLIKINDKNKETEEVEEEVSVDWKTIYTDYLLDGNLKDYVSARGTYPTITFVDLDNDKIPELMFYDGMEGGPRDNTSYDVYRINSNNEVERVGQVWNGPFKRIGYNKKNDTYAFETDPLGISYNEEMVTIYTENGLEEKITDIDKKAYSLEDDGYELKEIKLNETTFSDTFTDETRKEHIEDAINEYKTIEELIK